MSNSTIFSTRLHGKFVSAVVLLKMQHLTKIIRRRQNSSIDYLDTGHLDDHVLKDIGLDRSDLTKIE